MIPVLKLALLGRPEERVIAFVCCGYAVRYSRTTALTAPVKANSMS